MFWDIIEFDEYVSPDGLHYPFVDKAGARSLRFAVSGQGMPKVDYITQTGPLQDGSTVVDYRLRERTVAMLYRHQGESRDQYWDIRADLLNALRPNRQVFGASTPGTLVKMLPDGSRRNLDVFIEDGPGFEADDEDWDSWAIEEALRFIAHNPLFYDPDTMSISATSDVTLELVFPITFPIKFDSGLIDVAAIVGYQGTWRTYPEIVITGPLDQPQIINAITAEKVQLDYNIAATEVVTITLDGEKTVENNDTPPVNLIGTVSTDSDLASFALYPDPIAPDGNNQIQIRGANAVQLITDVTLNWNARYIGI